MHQGQTPGSVYLDKFKKSPRFLNNIDAWVVCPEVVKQEKNPHGCTDQENW